MKKLGLVLVVAIVGVVLWAGFSHHWRLKRQRAVQNCATGVMIDDGSSLLFFMNEPCRPAICSDGTAAKMPDAQTLACQE